MQGVALRQTFDGGDARAVGLSRQHGAGFDGLSVEMHGAAAALAGVAAEVRAGQAELLAQQVDEQGPVFALNGLGLAIDGEFDVHGDIRVFSVRGKARGLSGFSRSVETFS